MSFPVPFGRWIAAGWRGVVRDVLLDSRCRQRGLFAPDAVEQLLSGPTNPPYTSDTVWTLFNVELWYRTFIDGDGVQTLSAPQLVAA